MANLQPKLPSFQRACARCPLELGDCAITDFNLWQADPNTAVGNVASIAAAALPPTSDFTIPARRLIVRERDRPDFIPFVCQGWAACSTTLSDGRRQILSFLLPGDIAPTSMVFELALEFSIEAITDVHCRTVKCTAFKSVLMRNADLFEKFNRICSYEMSRANQLAIDLGRRDADERIARLILNLYNRMKQRGLVRDRTFDFPLRQHHIADATGLTAVHVSKVLSEFRRSGCIAISDRSLTLCDPAGFNAIADIR
jgi:CRP-like cAMP-binding protein